MIALQGNGKQFVYDLCKYIVDFASIAMFYSISNTGCLLATQI